MKAGKIDPEAFRVGRRERVKLAKRPTRIGPFCRSTAHCEMLLAIRKRLAK